MTATVKAIHICNSHKQIHTAKNCKKVCLANAERKTGETKHENLTSCIVHLADSANIKDVTSNKLCSGLTGSCFETPNDTIHVNVLQASRKNNQRHDKT